MTQEYVPWSNTVAISDMKILAILTSISAAFLAEPNLSPVALEAVPVLWEVLVGSSSVG